MDQSKSQVFRCYVRKRPGFDVEAQGQLRNLREQLGIGGLDGLSVFNRYDVEGVSREVYERARETVFSEPQVDAAFDEEFPRPAGSYTCWRWRPCRASSTSARTPQGSASSS